MTTYKDVSLENPSKANLLCVTDKDYFPISGSVASAASAVRLGCDLHRFSTYLLEGTGIVEETMKMQTTWLFDNDNVGGFQTLRHPVEGGLGVSMRPCMALWIFSVANIQRCAFVPLDGKAMGEKTWAKINNEPYSLAKDEFVPSRYIWKAINGWEQIYAHDKHGDPLVGNWNHLSEAVSDGCVIKVGIKNLWSVMTPSLKECEDHEVFIECTTNFAHRDEKFFSCLTLPTFMLQPVLPLLFKDGYFVYGWLVVRSDGKVQLQIFDASSMSWKTTWKRFAIRWFAKY
jgi:hypothetical protein